MKSFKRNNLKSEANMTLNIKGNIINNNNFK